MAFQISIVVVLRVGRGWGVVAILPPRESLAILLETFLVVVIVREV